MSEPQSRPLGLKAVVDQLNAAEQARAAEKRAKFSPRARTVARLAAVQALWQLELTGAGVETVIREFVDHRFDADLEGQPLAEADEAYFGEIVRGVVADQEAVDRAIVRRLAQGWNLDRIDSTVRAILRVGTWELSGRRDTPTEVVIDECVELAKAFFDTDEAKFVNGALDAVARDLRA